MNMVLCLITITSNLWVTDLVDTNKLVERFTSEDYAVECNVLKRGPRWDSILPGYKKVKVDCTKGMRDSTNAYAEGHQDNTPIKWLDNKICVDM